MAVLRVTGLHSKRLPPATKASKHSAPSSKATRSSEGSSTSKQTAKKNASGATRAYDLRLYDNTMLSDFRRCPRMWFYRHGLGWRPQTPSSALIFGNAWHNAMDVVWRLVCWEKQRKDQLVVAEALKAFEACWEEMDGPLTIEQYEASGYAAARGPVRTVETAHEMLIYYTRDRRSVLTDPDFKLLDIERPFAVPIDPANPDLYYVGRLDKVARVRGKLRIYEHKTTTLGSGSSGFQQRWIASFSPNTQVEGYLYAGSMLYGEPIKDVFVDGALVHASEHGMFRFVPVEKQWQTLDSWLWEAHYWISQVESNKAAMKRHEEACDWAASNDPAASPPPRYLAAWPKNTNVCTDFSGCPYLDVCRVTSDPTQRALPPGFRVEHWSPFDVLKLERIFEGNKLVQSRGAKKEPR